MAKRKDLLLTEATVSRFMGLAGIGSLANPFLKEDMGLNNEGDEGIIDPAFEPELEEGDDHEVNEYGLMDDGQLDEDSEELYEDSEEDGLYEEEGKECPKCGEVHEEGMCKEEEMNESLRKSMRRLKRLLEQAEAPPEGGAEPPPEGGAEPPPAMESGGELEDKIKEFVKKLGELVQETLGVEVKVEEEGEGEAEEAGGGEGETGAPVPAGGGAAPPPAPPAPPPAPLAEAINRLVNKVARRVKARLMEAKKDPKAEAKAKKMKMMKEKQMAEKKKKMEMEAKKKKMEMERKKRMSARRK